MAMLTYLPAAVLALGVTIAVAIGMLGPNASLDPLSGGHVPVVAPSQAGGAGPG